VYNLDQPAPIPEWQTPGDPRAKIRIADLLHMSSGLRIKAPQDPDYDATGPYPDHIYLYTGGIDSFHYAATRPLQWPPNTVGRYHNTDPVLISYLIRLGVEKRGDEYLSLAQRRRAISSPARCLLHGGCRRPDDTDDSLARSGRGASRALSRRICRCRRLEQGARAVDRGGAKSTK